MADERSAAQAFGEARWPVADRAPVKVDTLRAVAVDAVTVLPSTSGAKEWDAFAQTCGASFRGSHAGARGWRFENGVAATCIFLDVHLDDGSGARKVGQCAISRSRSRACFGDGIQLLPGHSGRWIAAMSSILVFLGPCLCTYGSEWSLEGRRDGDCLQLAGVTVTDFRVVFLAAIDFRQWPDWDAYFASVSSNVRRNIKKCMSRYGPLTNRRREGLNAVRDAWTSMRLRSSMYKRKGMKRQAVRMIFRSLVRMLLLRHYTVSVCSMSGRTTLAFFQAVEFGSNTFFLEGAAVAENGGSEWRLLMDMIREGWMRTGGRGLFVMGPDDLSARGQAAWDGLVRSRLQCRATMFPTSVIHFSYSAP